MRGAVIFFLSTIGLISISGESSYGQVRVVGPGSTPQGDILRGEGIYLQGLGWYELNDAKAQAANADTMIKLERWNAEVQAAYRQRYNAAVERDNYRTAREFQEAQRKHEEKEQRLRTKPNAADLASGDALNALLSDLSDPTIQSSSWRGAQVPLPPDISIRALTFQFATKPGADGTQELSKGLIALGRLDMRGKWPIYLSDDKIKDAREAFEKAYRVILEQSKARQLNLPAIKRLDESMTQLAHKVNADISPERNFRTSARGFVSDLKQATRMFDAETIGFAQEMIADTNSHDAQTVGELLAFMRKYRLVFAKASSAPGGEAIYHELYGLLTQQVEALGLKRAAPEGAAPIRAANHLFQTGSVWANGDIQVMTVLERNGNQFRANFSVSSGRIIRIISGTIEGDAIKWMGKDDIAIKGQKGGDNFGVIHGDEMTTSYSVNGGPLQSGATLRLKHK